MDKDVVIYVHTGEYDLAIKRTNKQKPKLIAKEIKLVVTRGRGWGGGGIGRKVSERYKLPVVR